MDEEEQKMYSNRSKNRQIRTYANLHMSSNEADEIHHQIRESFKSVNNLNSSEMFQQSKNRRQSNEPIHYPTDRQQSRNKSKSRSNHRIKIKNKDNGDLDHVEALNQADSEKETIKVCNDRLSRYETIVSLTEQENENLKQQNKYLLDKLRKMQLREDKIRRLYEKTKNYKLKWIETKNQIEIVREQAYIYRSLLQDFKEIALVDIPVLKQKVEDTKQAVQEDVRQSQRNMSKEKKERVHYSESHSSDKKKGQSREYESILQLAEEGDPKGMEQDQNQLIRYSPK